jgi:hypothetical protein
VPGSLEQAIAAYAPGVFRPVQEGALPPAKPGARCPPEMGLVLDAVCVDRYEASLVEQAPDGTLAPHAPSHSPEPGHVYVARSVAGVLPQGYASGAQAQSACREAGKRLCSPVEWRVACGGSEGWAFPYGPDRVPGRCHDSGANPMLTYHADTQSRGWGSAELNDPRNLELEGTVTKTGAFAACVNDFGLYDMVGNLHEWTADPNGTFQGGYWLDTSLHGEGCAYRTIAHPFVLPRLLHRVPLLRRSPVAAADCRDHHFARQWDRHALRTTRPRVRAGRPVRSVPARARARI